MSTILLAAIATPGLALGQDTLASRIRNWSETDQIAWIRSTLDKGMPVDLSSALDTLVLGKSTLAFPLIEKKIEEVLKSSSPLDCFTDKSVDPERFVHLAGQVIAYAGNEEALRAISRLIRLDEKRFGFLVEHVLSGARIPRNPFALSYRGLGIGDPVLDKRIVAWVESRLADKTESGKQLWAGALVERYGSPPVKAELDADPLFSRLNPALAESLYADLYRYAVEVWEKNPRRMLAMSEAEQIGFTKSYLDQGLPPERREAMAALIRVRSSLVLPLIESRLEELLKSKPKLEEVFGDSPTPSGRIVARAILAITEGADEQALKESGKLLRLDERLFGVLVPEILDKANTLGNPFVLAYRGLDLGDPLVSKGIVTWAGQCLNLETRDHSKDMRHQLAEAMLDRYSSPAIEAQWAKDPIISRLKPALAESLHGNIPRFAIEASEKRSRK